MRNVHVTRWLALTLIATLFVSCSGTKQPGSEPLVLSKSPEFVNRVIPGRRPLAIVTATSGSGDAATLTGTSTLSGMTVSFVPERLVPGGSAEVWVDAPEVMSDVPFTVSVQATRGAESPSVTIDATVVPGVDDLSDTARQIAQVFLGRLGGQVAGLPTDATALTSGTPVAGLLVVTHYAWFTDTYEIGLAWHIMVAPDDFAEMYLRPRGERVPTRTYRISSWSNALAGGAYQFSEVAPTAEVVR